MPSRRVNSAKLLTFGGAVDPQSLSLTSDLSPALEVLKRNLEYTARALSSATFRRVWRQTLGRLSDLLWNQVLFHHSFTTLGAKQLVRDLAGISAVARSYLQADHLTLLREGVTLLALPVELSQGQLDLRRTYDQIFSGNAEARETLKALRLQGLTPTNARNILQRRVEAGK